MPGSEADGRPIIVDLYDIVEEVTVAQCGPFATAEEAHAFVDEHRGKAKIYERLRAGYLPRPEGFVGWLDRRVEPLSESAPVEGGAQ